VPNVTRLAAAARPAHWARNGPAMAPDHGQQDPAERAADQPARADWWRLLDALVLVAAHPAAP
jgi:hypothetical protein